MAIRTIGTTGGDFTSLNAWEATLPATLLEDEIAELLDMLADFAAETFNVTTSDTARIIIRAAAGAETDYKPATTKAGFQGTTSGGFGVIHMRGGCRHIVCENIAMRQFTLSQQIINTGPTTGTGGQVTLTNCLCLGNSPTSIPFLNSAAGGSGLLPVVADNCVGYGLSFDLPTGQPHVFTNCTNIAGIPNFDNSRAGFRNVTAVRCYGAHYGPTSSFGDFLNLIAGSTDNASFDTSGNITGLDPSAQYTDTVNGDYSFKAGNGLAGAAAGGADIGFVMPTGGGGGVAGTIAATMPGLTGSSAGIVRISGTAATAMPGLAGSSAGAVHISGTVAAAISGLTGLSEGTIRIAGNAAAMVAALEAASVGGLKIDGVGAAILPGLLASGVAGGISGVGAAILGAMTADASGTIRISGTGAMAVAAARAAAAGGLILRGEAAAVLAAFGVVASGTIRIGGDIAGPLPGVTADGTATLTIPGTVEAVLAALKFAGTSEAEIAIIASPARTVVIRAGERTLTIETGSRRTSAR